MSTPAAPTPCLHEYAVVVPVKPPARGKSRLVGLPDDQRRALAEAFALDTLDACRAARRVGAVLVATDDAGFAAALTALGVPAVPDGVSGDLNASLHQAAAEAVRRWPGLRPVALCADLPALRPAELDAALAAVTARGEQPAYVADADGTGTTLYTAPFETFAPRFGPGSAGRHDELALPVRGELSSLRRDVDDLADLRAALALGVGPRTADLAARHGLAPAP